jgi:hypothetical protein
MIAFKGSNNLYPDKTARCYKEDNSPDRKLTDEERRMYEKAAFMGEFMDKNRPPRALLGETEEED